MSQQLSSVGKRLPRYEAPEKAVGAAIYTTDIKLPGMLIGKVLRSPYAHAKILKIDISQAEKLHGVEAVITLENIPKKLFNMAKVLMIARTGTGGEPRDQYILTDKARYVGDAVAAVAAINESVAEEALGLIKVEYEQLLAVFNPIQATEPDAPRVHDFAERNIAWRQVFPGMRGNIEKGFAEADYVVKETFHTSKQKHGQLEQSACVACFDAAGRLKIWSPDQQPFLARRMIADLFDIPEGMIRWLTPYVGGAFGNGLSLRAEPICIALAKKSGQPVKLEYTVEEQFIATESRQPFIQAGKIGVKKDGTITALQTKLIADAGAYFSLSGATTDVNLASFLSLYRCNNVAGEAEIVYTNTPVSGGMRGYGNPSAMFALEQLIDIAAEKIGMDPLEFRLKNHCRMGDPSMRPSIPIESCALDKCIRAGAERIDWGKKRAREKRGVIKQGVGMAVGMHVSGTYPKRIGHTSASIMLNEDGSANLAVNTCEAGQGILGVLAQIAAEELGLRAEHIRIVTGDTDTTMFDVGWHASRQTYVMGNAVLMAAREAREQLLERAAEMLGISPDNLESKDGRVYVSAAPGENIPVAEVARNAIYDVQGKPWQISGKCSWEAQGNPYPFQAVFAEVAVDTETGKVTVVKVVAAHDIGRAINPVNVEGQMEGGILQGIGFSLMEDYVINKSTGTVESYDFTTYKLPSMLDVPVIDVILVESPVASGPFGAKSVGESSLIAVPAAIANAIYDAVGVRIKDLPITPEKVLDALQVNECIVMRKDKG